MKRWPLVLLTLLFASWPVLADVHPVGVPRWQTLAPGFDVLRQSYAHSDGTSFELLAVRASLSKYILHVLPQKTARRAEEVRQAYGAPVVINGPFFDTDGRPMGLLVAHSEVIQPMPPPSSANGTVLAVRGPDTVIEQRQVYVPRHVTEAVQCAPRLVVQGHPTGGLLDANHRAPRTVVALGSGYIYFVCTTSVLQQASLTDMQEVLVTRPFSVQTALAMDGGASTQMSVRVGGFEAQVLSRDPVPVFLEILQDESLRHGAL